MKESKLPWLKLDIEFPYEKMLDEAKSCKRFFVKHRAEDQIHGYKHSGWSSLCIHGISSTHIIIIRLMGLNPMMKFPIDELNSLLCVTRLLNG